MATFDYGLKDELVMKYTSLSLSNDPYYRTRFALQNNQLFMSCGYCSRNKSRWVIITDFQGDVLLPQTFLKYGKRCELNFMAEVLNLHYYITLKPNNKNKIFKDYDYINWANDFQICFVGYEQKLQDRLQLNKRVFLVGN